MPLDEEIFLPGNPEGVGGLEKAVSDLVNEIRKDRTEGTGSRAKQIGLLAKQTIGFKIGNAFLDSIHKAIAEVNALQKNALSLGRTSGQVLNEMSANIKNLPGGISTSMQSFIEMTAEGLRARTKSAVLLSNQMKLTGQSSSRLSINLRALEAIGRVQEDGIESLTSKILGLSENFSIQTGRLVESLNLVGDRLLEFGELGIAGKFSESMATLTAAIGPGMEDTLKTFLNEFTADTTEGYAGVFKMGAQDLRQAFAETGDLNTLMQALRQYANKQDSLNDAFGGFQDDFRRQGLITEEFGRAGRAAATLIKEMDRRGIVWEEYVAAVEVEKELRNQFNQSLEALRVEFLDPFIRIAVPIFSSMVKAVVFLKEEIMALGVLITVSMALRKAQMLRETVTGAGGLSMFLGGSAAMKGMTKAKGHPYMVIAALVSTAIFYAWTRHQDAQLAVQEDIRDGVRRLGMQEETRNRQAEQERLRGMTTFGTLSAEAINEATRRLLIPDEDAMSDAERNQLNQDLITALQGLTEGLGRFQPVPVPGPEDMRGPGRINPGLPFGAF